MEAQVQKGSPDILKLVFRDIADKRPGADADVFATPALSQDQLQSLLVKLSISGSRSTVPGNSRSIPAKAARTQLPQQRTVQDTRVNRVTDELRRRSHRAHDPRGDGHSRDHPGPVNDSASHSSEMNDSGASEDDVHRVDRVLMRTQVLRSE